MENEILFTETQKFKQWWLWAIFLVVNGLSLFGVFKQVIGGQQFGEDASSNIGLVLITGLTILLTILFINFRLDTKIKNNGVYVRFFPIHLRFRQYPWDKLSKAFVRRYNPILECGGWGLRFGLFGKGKVFNVSGNTGLQLKFTNNKRLLIGTNKPEELTETLKKIGQLKQ